MGVRVRKLYRIRSIMGKGDIIEVLTSLSKDRGKTRFINGKSECGTWLLITTDYSRYEN